MKKYIRDKFFHLWGILFINHKSQQIQEVRAQRAQNTCIRSKVFAAWREYSAHRASRGGQKETADQEYRWWLAKRFFRGWDRTVFEERNKRELLQFIEIDKNRALATKVLEGLRLYVQYKDQRREADVELTRDIQQLKKRTFLKLWHKLLCIRSGARFFEVHMQRVELRLAFDRISGVGQFFSQVVAIQNEEKPGHLIRTAFKSLRTHARKNRLAAQAVILIRERSVYTHMAHVMHHWGGIVEQRNRQYRMYGFCIKSLKDWFIRPYFDALRWSNQYSKHKALAVQHFVSEQKTKVFGTLKQLSKRSQQLGQAYECVVQERAYKLKVHTMLGWLETFQKRMKMQVHGAGKKKMWKSQLLNAWKCVTANLACDGRRFRAKTAVLGKSKARRVVKELQANAKKSKLAKLRMETFGAGAKQRMVAAVLRHWRLYFTSNLEEIRKRAHIRRGAQMSLIGRCLERWYCRAEPRVERVRACRAILKLKATSKTRTGFLKWVAETNALIRIETCEEAVRENVGAMRLKRALKQVRINVGGQIIGKNKKRRALQFRKRRLLAWLVEGVNVSIKDKF